MRAPATSRRRRVGIACGGAAALAGLREQLDLDGDPDDPAANPSSTGSTGTDVGLDDPDAAAVDEAVATTQELLDLLAAGGPRSTPAGCSPPCTPRTSPYSRTASLGVALPDDIHARRRRTPARWPGSGGESWPPQREFARLGVAASSGALARLLASMSAGVAAHLAATAPAREPR